jgi:formylglycine-generating enzyme
MGDACCAPGRREDSQRDARPLDAVPRGAGSPPATLVEIVAATFRMGDNSIWAYRGDGESPVHEVELTAFLIDRFAVANSEFAKFVDATGWRTDAERYGWSFVFAGLLPDDFPVTRAVVGAEWWRQVMHANWRQPEGPHSDLTGREDHPVVHVSWNDANAFCRWTGTRLPTEAEWECAARGRIQDHPFPWGDDLEPDGEHRMNVFQGRFPDENTGADGFQATAPIDAYEPNGFGLYNLTGNVWEWCGDWLDVDYYGRSPRRNPGGPETGTTRVQRGGSYLCHESYCRRYRVSARFGSEPDSSTGNLGFRVAADAAPA